MTIHWKAVEQYFTVVLFVFQFYPVCNFGGFINFGLGTVRSERVKTNDVISSKILVFVPSCPQSNTYESFHKELFVSKFERSLW